MGGAHFCLADSDVSAPLNKRRRQPLLRQNMRRAAPAPCSQPRGVATRTAVERALPRHAHVARAERAPARGWPLRRAPVQRGRVVGEVRLRAHRYREQRGRRGRRTARTIGSGAIAVERAALGAGAAERGVLCARPHSAERQPERTRARAAGRPNTLERPRARPQSGGRCARTGRAADAAACQCTSTSTGTSATAAAVERAARGRLGWRVLARGQRAPDEERGRRTRRLQLLAG